MMQNWSADHIRFMEGRQKQYTPDSWQEYLQ